MKYFFLLASFALCLTASAQSFTRTDIATPVKPYNLDVGDFDADGDLDIATVNDGAHSVTILLNDGTGAFSIGSTLTGFNRPQAITAGDFDANGTIDLGVVNAGANSAFLVTNDGSASFSITDSVTVGNRPHAITSADLDGDSDLDWVVSDFSSGTVSLFPSTLWRIC